MIYYVIAPDMQAKDLEEVSLTKKDKVVYLLSHLKAMEFAKIHPNEAGFQSKIMLRKMREFHEKGQLVVKDDQKLTPYMEYFERHIQNRILALCKELARNDEADIVLLTKDEPFREQVIAFGIPAK